MIRTFLLPIRTFSESNMREHWSKKYKRKNAQQLTTRLMLGAVIEPWPTVRVRLTRLGPRKLDTDNNVSSFKHVQDAVAAWLFVDDGSERVTWEYGQEKSKTYSVRVEVET